MGRLCLDLESLNLASSALDLVFSSTGEKHLSTEVPAKIKPAKVRTAVQELRASLLSWSDLAAKTEHRTALHLRGIPKLLGDETTFKAFLAGQGLLEKVASVCFTPGSARQTGCAILVAKTPEDVPALAKFFHGRQIMGSRPIAVSFASGHEDKLQKSPGDGVDARELKLQSLAPKAPGAVSPTASTDLEICSPRSASSCSGSHSSQAESSMEPPPGLGHLKPSDVYSEGKMGPSRGTLTSMHAKVILPPPGLEHFRGAAWATK